MSCRRVRGPATLSASVELSNRVKRGTTAEEAGGKLDTEQNIGRLGAIDVAKMVPVPRFKERLAQMCREIKATPLAAGASAIFIPREIEAEKKARRQREGIPIAAGVEREVREVAQELGISFP
ncbi:MAG: Ldh family oxidoreductase [Chloroflexota bacterium]|nr:Ldh family oxidoreductase [Chloroflexota bacterium]